jgi:hypothetical protein
MVPSTTREYRQKLINTIGPDRFETYYDYFFYLHLNTHVQIMHAVGMVSGLLLLPFVIYLMSWPLLILYTILFYGFGFAAHWIFDGAISRTAKEAPWYSFIYALKINWLAMTGKMKTLEIEFQERYPFTREVFH